MAPFFFSSCVGKVPFFRSPCPLRLVIGLCRSPFSGVFFLFNPAGTIFPSDRRHAASCAFGFFSLAQVRQYRQSGAGRRSFFFFSSKHEVFPPPSMPLCTSPRIAACCAQRPPSPVGNFMYSLLVNCFFFTATHGLLFPPITLQGSLSKMGSAVRSSFFFSWFRGFFSSRGQVALCISPFLGSRFAPPYMDVSFLPQMLGTPEHRIVAWKSPLIFFFFFLFSRITFSPRFLFCRTRRELVCSDPSLSFLGELTDFSFFHPQPTRSFPRTRLLILFALSFQLPSPGNPDSNRGLPLVKLATNSFSSSSRGGIAPFESIVPLFADFPLAPATSFLNRVFGHTSLSMMTQASDLPWRSANSFPPGPDM